MKSSLSCKTSRVLLIASVLFTSGYAVAENGIYLVQPGPGYDNTLGRDLSDDGTTLVGGQGGAGDPLGFRYTVAGGRQDFATPGPVPFVTSSDGRFTGGPSVRVVGVTLEFRFFRESISGGVTNLANAFPSVAAMSASGNAMCGYNTLSGNRPEAFVWTPLTGMNALRHRTVAIDFSVARDMTADGLTIVGDYNSVPMTWRVETGMQQLPSPEGSTGLGSALAVSPNGQHIVGETSRGANMKFLTVWNADRSPQALVPLGPSENPTSVTNDGFIVGDWGGGSRGAWIWSAETGKMSLRDYASMNGFEIDPNLNLVFCNSVSLDGRTFVGSVQLPDGSGRAFMLVIPSPATGVLLSGLGAMAARRRRS